MRFEHSCQTSVRRVSRLLRTGVLQIVQAFDRTPVRRSRAAPSHRSHHREVTMSAIAHQAPIIERPDRRAHLVLVPTGPDAVPGGAGGSGDRAAAAAHPPRAPRHRRRHRDRRRAAGCRSRRPAGDRELRAARRDRRLGRHALRDRRPRAAGPADRRRRHRDPARQRAVLQPRSAPGRRSSSRRRDRLTPRRPRWLHHQRLVCDGDSTPPQRARGAAPSPGVRRSAVPPVDGGP